ncbi:MAG: hypothetical protein GY719_35205 [bacterium]|nr:hypothetical protein [bacterium]
MGNQALTIHVTPETAQAYEAASPEERRKLDAVLSRKLREAMRRLKPGEAPATTAESGRRRLTANDLLESGLVGMWQDRPEARDSAAFARQLREKAQRR